MRNWKTIQKMKIKFQKRRRSHTGRNARWLPPPRSLIWIRVHTLLLLGNCNSDDRQLFRGDICPFALSLLFPELVLPETSYPTCIFSSCLLSPFFLCRPNKKENIFHLDELGEKE